MTTTPFRRAAAAVLAVAAAAAQASRCAAEEGMWLINDPPRKLLHERYGFDVSDEWLVHLQRSSLRFGRGGSASFVSSQGLVLTNHHVGMDCLQELSTADRDLVTDGYLARTIEDEIPCVNVELNQLVDIEDVTRRVSGAVPAGADTAAAQRARQAEINTIEKESLDATGLRSDVVTLYHGAKYHLYRYRRYTDVRLVFAPHKEAAYFGGDPDNFEYPRHCLDMCLFRVYDEGQPLRPEHYLKWSASGCVERDLVFVTGHPGRTDRLNTVAHLEFMRDRVFPLALDVIRRREVNLLAFSARGQENARRAQDELASYQNNRKVRLGGLAGLHDPALWIARRLEELQLVNAAKAQHAVAGSSPASAWERIAAAVAVWDEIYVRHYLLERGMAFDSSLFAIGRNLVRLADESAKPNAQRLREFSDSNRASLEQNLYSEAPIYSDLETLKLADSLSLLVEKLGASSDVVVAVLDGMSPRDRAAQLVSGTRLADVEVRRQIAQGGRSAIEASDDPMLELARRVDAAAREVRTVYEEQVEEPLRQAYADVAGARFASQGDSTYPDATFTLRLAFGEVRGYAEGHVQLPAWTTFGSAFSRAGEQEHHEPYRLPALWYERKDRLDLDTPFNFICTADIIGGNSGSPVVNRQGDFVGLIFDGNIQSLVLDFVYTDHQARAIAVDARGILAALRDVYDAGHLADELHSGE